MFFVVALEKKKFGRKGNLFWWKRKPVSVRKALEAGRHFPADLASLLRTKKQRETSNGVPALEIYSATKVNRRNSFLDGYESPENLVQAALPPYIVLEYGTKKEESKCATKIEYYTLTSCLVFSC